MDNTLPPEEDFLMEAAPPRRVRPEAVLGFLALLAAACLIAAIVVSVPYFGQEDDPEFTLHQSHIEMENLEEASPLEAEDIIPETTTEPTIPPEANPYTSRDFQYNRHNYLLCQKQDSYPGVDVSSFQGSIDWEKVSASGIRFAMVRLGYRGWGAAGKLVADENAAQNLKGAKEAGLAVGAYFFSQATSIADVDEEIDFLLGILGDQELDMPLVLDWEYISEEARTANVDRRTLTDCLLHFCRAMDQKGFKPMIYFNWTMSSRLLYLNELEEYPFWLALYQDRMTYPFRVEMWQYTCEGRVPGIDGNVDIDVFMPDFRKQNG